jgi:methylated-DNA-[protein]-cysteine S-methyltransferase
MSLKEYLVKGRKGFPNLIVRFKGNTIAQIQFIKAEMSPKRRFYMTKGEKHFLADFQHDISAYFQGKSVEFGKYKIKFEFGTDFQKSVWRILRRIPCGETRTYKWIAGKIGKPRSARAIGQACRANPVPLLLPCHRVIASDGSLAGFSGGIDLKKMLLILEGNVLS